MTHKETQDKTKALNAHNAFEPPGPIHLWVPWLCLKAVSMVIFCKNCLFMFEGVLKAEDMRMNIQNTNGTSSDIFYSRPRVVTTSKSCQFSVF